MKNTIVLIVLLNTFQFFGQNDQKTAFQKNKYELALSYYQKADFAKAIDLFSLAAKIKPENEVGKDALKKVDTLREILRKEILKHAIGTWKRTGNQPVWAISATNLTNQPNIDEIVEIKEDEIFFYEVDNKTKVKKLLKTENLVYNNANSFGSAFSEIILSDGTVWDCHLNETADVLRVINVAVKTETGIERIKGNNEENYYIKL